MTTKLIRPLDPKQTGGAPYIRLTCAARLTGLGMTTLRTLPVRKFGNAHYGNVAAINALITGTQQEGAK